jgi:hypothetical protein
MASSHNFKNFNFSHIRVILVFSFLVWMRSFAPPRRTEYWTYDNIVHLTMTKKRAPRLSNLRLRIRDPNNVTVRHPSIVFLHWNPLPGRK